MNTVNDNTTADLNPFAKARQAEQAASADNNELRFNFALQAQPNGQSMQVNGANLPTAQHINQLLNDPSVPKQTRQTTLALNASVSDWQLQTWQKQLATSALVNGRNVAASEVITDPGWTAYVDESSALFELQSKPNSGNAGIDSEAQTKLGFTLQNPGAQTGYNGSASANGDAERSTIDDSAANRPPPLLTVLGEDDYLLNKIGLHHRHNNDYDSWLKNLFYQPSDIGATPAPSGRRWGGAKQFLSNVVDRLVGQSSGVNGNADADMITLIGVNVKLSDNGYGSPASLRRY